MADGDQALETRLRSAFLGEVAGRPVATTDDHLAATWRSRRLRKRVLPSSILAVAAMVVILVVAISPRLAVTPTGAGLSSAPAAPLASYQDLVALLPNGGSTSAVEGEQAAAVGSTGAVTTDLGAIGAGSPVFYALSCDGDGVAITFDTGDTTPGTMNLACGTTGPAAGSLTWEAGPARVSVAAPSAMAWRLALSTGSGPARDLEPFEELRLAAQKARTVGGVTIARGESPQGGAAGSALTKELGTVGAVTDIQLVLDCMGGNIEVRVQSGESLLVGYRTVCQPTVDIENLRVAAPAADARIIVVADPGVSWRLLAVGPMPTAAQSPNAQP